MKYDNFRYIFPPRPENTIPSDELDFWDNGSLIAQPKLNGSNCVIFTNGVKSFVMNRHNQRMTNFNLTQDEINSLYRGNGGWTVINAEYMNKSNRDETKQFFNHKLVIFDILVYNGEYLLDTTFEERIKLLDDLFGKIDENKYLYKITDNIFRVKSFYDNFLEKWNDITKTEVFEGFVLKKKQQKLIKGLSEKNNLSHKCRRTTKNYRH